MWVNERKGKVPDETNYLEACLGNVRNREGVPSRRMSLKTEVRDVRDGVRWCSRDGFAIVSETVLLAQPSATFDPTLAHLSTQYT